MTYIVVYFAGRNKYDHSQDVQESIRFFADETEAIKYYKLLEQHDVDSLVRSGFCWMEVFLIKKGAGTLATHMVLDLPLEKMMEVNVAAKEARKKKKKYPTNLWEMPYPSMTSNIFDETPELETPMP